MIQFFILQKKLLLFIFFSVIRSYSDSVSNTGLYLEWTGSIRDPYLSIVTSDGYFHYINILTGDVLWSLDTGGRIYSSTDSKRIKYFPSIDGFLFSFIPEYGFRRLPVPIRDLAYISPFKTEMKDIFSSQDTTSMFFLNEEGKVISHFKSNSSFPSSFSFDKNNLIVIRIDYYLNIYGDSSQIIKYSDFDLNIQERKKNVYENNQLNKVKITTNFNGFVIVELNGDVICQTKISGKPIKVIGDCGQFKFTMKNNGAGMQKSSVLIMDLDGTNVAVPSCNLEIPSKFEMFIYGLPALNGKVGLQYYTVFQYGFFDIHRPFMSFAPLDSSIDPSRPADKMIRDLSSTLILKINRVNYKYVSCIVLIFYATLLFTKIYIQTKVLHRKSIVVDKNDKSKGLFHNVKCNIVYLDNGANVNLLNEIKQLNIPGIVEIKGIEFDKNKYLVACQQLKLYDFNNFDMQLFIRKIIETLTILFQNGLVHGNIKDSTIYTDSHGFPILGGFEKTIHYSTNKEEKSFDILSVGKIIKKYFDNSDPLAIDLINKMTCEVYSEIPAPDVILKHPFFISSLHRIEIISHAMEFLQNNPDIRKIFDEKTHEIVGDNWLKLLDQNLLTDAMNYRDYNGQSLFEMVKFIRNKWYHSPNGQKKDPASKYFDYFNRLFPNFFIYLYYFLAKYDVKYCLE